MYIKNINRKEKKVVKSLKENNKNKMRCLLYMFDLINCRMESSSSIIIELDIGNLNYEYIYDRIIESKIAKLIREY